MLSLWVSVPWWAGHVPGIRYALQGDLAGPGHHAAVARGDHDDGGHGFGCSAVPCGDKAQATSAPEYRGEDRNRPPRGTGGLWWDARISCPIVTPRGEAWGALPLAGAWSLGGGGPQPIALHTRPDGIGAGACAVAVEPRGSDRASAC